jgi:hypothetical protein
VQYKLWSRGRLLGETDLGFIYRENGHRTGWLHPNELGQRLMPEATGVAPAMRIEWILGSDETARADIQSAADREEALALELRRADGTVIPTEHIAIIDTHYRLSLPEPEFDDDEDVELDEEILADFEELQAEWEMNEILSANAPETEFPQYQIQIRLIDPADVP